MKKRRRNNTKTSRKKQKTVHSINDEELPVHIKEEVVEDEEGAVDTLSFPAVKMEPKLEPDVDIEPFFMERVLLPECSAENFLDESKDVKPEVDHLAYVEPKQEIDLMALDDTNPEQEYILGPEFKIEQVDTGSQFGTIASEDGGGENFSEPPVPPLACEIVEEPLEMKIEVEEMWSEGSSSSRLPSLSHLFAAEEYDTHQASTSCASSKQTRPRRRKLLRSESDAEVDTPTAVNKKSNVQNKSTSCGSRDTPDESKTENSSGVGSISQQVGESEYFICHLCNITYTNWQFFSKHVTENHKRHIYCSKCKFLIKINNKSVVKKHEATCCELVNMNLHSSILGEAKEISQDKSCNEEEDEDETEIKHFICHLCDEHYSSLQSLNNHVSKYHKKYLYCVMCRCLIKVANSKELEKHEMSCCKIVQNKTYVCCNICVKPFENVGKMLKHVRTKHLDTEPTVSYDWKILSVFRCQNCLAVYQKEKDAMDHFIKQHLHKSVIKKKLVYYKKQLFFKCIYCSQCYPDLKNVTLHITNKHPNKSNITLQSFDAQNCTISDVKLETGTQTSLEDMDLGYKEYLYKLNQMDIAMEKQSKNKSGSEMSNKPADEEVSEGKSLVIASGLDKTTTISKIKTKLAEIKPVVQNNKLGIVSYIYCPTCGEDFDVGNYTSSHFSLTSTKHCACPFCGKSTTSMTSDPVAFLEHLDANCSSFQTSKEATCTKCKLIFCNEQNCIFHTKYKHVLVKISSHATEEVPGSEEAVSTEKYDIQTLINTCLSFCDNVSTCDLVKHAYCKLAIHCTVCSESISPSIYFSAHLQSCLCKTNIIPCIFCTTKFKISKNDISQYLEHIIANHITNKAMLTSHCRNCKLLFLSLYNEILHSKHQQCLTIKNVYTLKLPYGSDDIEKAMKTLELAFVRVKKILKHNEKLVIHCTVCKKDFSDVEYLTNHVLSCKNNKLHYECPFCYKHDTTNAILHFRDLMTHVTVNYTKIACVMCSSVFFTTYNRDHHLQAHVKSRVPLKSGAEALVCTVTSNK